MRVTVVCGPVNLVVKVDSCLPTGAPQLAPAR